MVIDSASLVRLMRRARSDRSHLDVVSSASRVSRAVASRSCVVVWSLFVPFRCVVLVEHGGVAELVLVANRVFLRDLDNWTELSRPAMLEVWNEQRGTT